MQPNKHNAQNWSFAAVAASTRMEDTLPCPQNKRHVRCLENKRHAVMSRMKDTTTKQTNPKMSKEHHCLLLASVINIFRGFQHFND